MKKIGSIIIAAFLFASCGDGSTERIQNDSTAAAGNMDAAGTDTSGGYNANNGNVTTNSGNTMQDSGRYSETDTSRRRTDTSRR